MQTDQKSRLPFWLGLIGYSFTSYIRLRVDKINGSQQFLRFVLPCQNLLISGRTNDTVIRQFVNLGLSPTHQFPKVLSYGTHRQTISSQTKPIICVVKHLAAVVCPLFARPCCIVFIDHVRMLNSGRLKLAPTLPSSGQNLLPLNSRPQKLSFEPMISQTSRGGPSLVCLTLL